MSRVVDQIVEEQHAHLFAVEQVEIGGKVLGVTAPFEVLGAHVERSFEGGADITYVKSFINRKLPAQVGSV